MAIMIPRVPHDFAPESREGEMFKSLSKLRISADSKDGQIFMLIILPLYHNFSKLDLY